MSGSTVGNDPLVDAMKAWNDFEVGEGCWKLYVGDYKRAVGYIEKNIMEATDWRSVTDQFVISPSRMTVTAKDPDTANKAFEDLYLANRGNQYFDEKTVDEWINRKNKAGVDPKSKKPDYHPIFTEDRADLQHLKVPSPLRGILGILTAGIHVNVYSTKNGEVDKIWVSERSQGKTYAGCYDQIIAGGMEPEHNRNPWATFRQECKEESMYKLDGDVFMRATDQKRIGTAEGPEWIHFFTNKANDKRVGPAEEGHIEPGVRFCFDVKIDEDEEPHHNPEDKSSSGFKPLTVAAALGSLVERNWKPNCGLVMLDFLRRKGLLSPEQAKAVENLKTPSFDLPIPSFPMER